MRKLGHEVALTQKKKLESVEAFALEVTDTVMFRKGGKKMMAVIQQTVSGNDDQRFIRRHSAPEALRRGDRENQSVAKMTTKWHQNDDATASPRSLPRTCQEDHQNGIKMILISHI